MPAQGWTRVSFPSRSGVAATWELRMGSKSYRKGLDTVGLVLGLLLAPAVVSFSMGTVLDVVLERLGANPEGPAAIMLTGSVLVVGVGVPYCATVFPGIPYVIALRGQGGLTFRTVMIPTGILSLIDPVFAYLSLCDMHPPHPLAEAAALPQVLAVILPGLCLYFIGVWKSGKRFS
jgi:hypothetical protein